MAENIIGEQGREEGPVALMLSCGKSVRVYPMSYRLYQAIERKWREPEVPTKLVKTIDGKGERMPDPKNPEYLAEVARVREGKGTAMMRLVAWQSLRDITVPEENGWVEEIREFEPEYQPPADAIGRKIDYLEYIFPMSGIDWQIVIYTAINENVLAPSEVEDAAKRFRNQISREAGKFLGNTLAAADLFDDAGNDTDREVGDDAVERVPATAKRGKGRADRGAKG